MTTWPDRIGLLKVYLQRIRAQSAVATLCKLLDLGRLRLHLARMVRGDARGLSNFYLPLPSRTDAIEFCSLLAASSRGAVEDFFAEIETDSLVPDLAKHYSEVRSTSPPLDVGRFRIWYALVRLIKPAVVLETGVHDGLSSCLILRAIERNRQGLLVSIDLPSTDLAPGQRPGWLVPESLRGPWRLELGDSRRLLPGLASQHAPLDIFIHDSDHSRAHRAFEYHVALANLRAGGLLCTDDDAEPPELLDAIATQCGGARFQVRATPLGDRIGGIRIRDLTPSVVP